LPYDLRNSSVFSARLNAPSNGSDVNLEPVMLNARNAVENNLKDQIITGMKSQKKWYMVVVVLNQLLLIIVQILHTKLPNKIIKYSICI